MCYTVSMKQIYRTYSKEVPAAVLKRFNTVKGSMCNKPVGGLWGCRGTEWLDWCTAEDFQCPDTYFEWSVSDKANIYHIYTEVEWVYLVSSFYDPLRFSIDYELVKKAGYDGVELYEEVNNKFHLGLVGDDFFKRHNIHNVDLFRISSFSTNAWDVPSICVWNKDMIEIAEVLV